MSAYRSVIVSIRGTWSMEDIITDSVADPMLLKDWLPKGQPQALRPLLTAQTQPS